MRLSPKRHGLMDECTISLKIMCGVLFLGRGEFAHLKAIFDVIRNMRYEKDDPVAFGNLVLRLSIGALQTLIASVTAVKLSVQKRLTLLGVPLGDKFADTFYDIFFPGQSFDKKEFLAKFGGSEYGRVGREKVGQFGRLLKRIFALQRSRVDT
jgi:hypothetical protein